MSDASLENQSLSAAEVEERVQKIGNGVVVMRECAAPTAQSIDQLFDRADRLFAQEDRRILVVDLVEAQMPSATIRAHLRLRFQSSALDDVKLVVGNNLLLKIAARFVMASLGFQLDHAYSTVEDAIRDIANG